MQPYGEAFSHYSSYGPASVMLCVSYFNGANHNEVWRLRQLWKHFYVVLVLVLFFSWKVMNIFNKFLWFDCIWWCMKRDYAHDIIVHVGQTLMMAVTLLIKVRGFNRGAAVTDYSHCSTQKKVRIWHLGWTCVLLFFVILARFLWSVSNVYGLQERIMGFKF